MTAPGSGSTFDPAVVATYGSTDASAPLVVLLHGRGSHEQDIVGLAGHLPAGPAYAAVRLAHLPVFVAQRDADHVIPRELLDRTWTYLHDESGAPTVAPRQPGGHQLTAATVHELGDWIDHRIA